MRHKGWLLATLAGLLGAASLGCMQLPKEAVWSNRMAMRAASGGNTVTESYAEHLHTVGTSLDFDARAIIEDLDMFWMRDRPTRLTKWHER